MIYLVLALLVFLSPVVLTHWKNVEQHKIAESYSRNVQKLHDGQRNAILERAHEYNRNLPQVGAVDPWVNGVDINSPGYQNYRSQLDVSGTMARLRVPAVGIDLPVYHGTQQDVLAHGVGHLYGTALPVGGEGTHTVLTGHTGLATLTMFDNLTHMKDGDIFTVEVMGEQRAYKVDQIKVVLPQDVQAIKAEPGKDYATLITCTPYGINSHRLLVRGERTELPAHIQDQRYKSPWQPWMVFAVGISIFVILYLLWRWWRSRKRKKQQEQQTQQR
ncbi:sortase family protein, LPXTG-site transpeptidase [Corynebacterium epidermidicanis]|uniref:Sortase family protein, LPXTG-site transpeptidase n=1 Tax=Corynebacterium epidermidicanis TaxID=1050174 RepID=A0A0G3GTP2_9CORY|nr:sortase family protein, LPXTG-site transpeptidase [Corynebacterium epidermidicanis]